MNHSKKNIKQSSAYEFFQYRYPPFADTFEIREPFRSKKEELILNRALTLIEQGKSLAIYGEAGAGKSMLLKSITNELDPKKYRIAIIPYGGLKSIAILRELCEAFDIDLKGRKNLIPRLQKNFQPKDDKPFPLLIIDDAHAMENQSFIDICSLLHDAESRTSAASVIFTGQPVLKKILELDIFSPVRTRLTCRLKLSKLNIEEAVDFIKFRLEIAETSTNIFNEQAMEAIASDSTGNRRLIMNLAALCMEEAAKRKEKIITEDIVNCITMEND